jgi:hypothetical protein
MRLQDDATSLFYLSVDAFISLFNLCNLSNLWMLGRLWTPDEAFVLKRPRAEV